MKTKKTLSALFAILMAAMLLLGTVLPAAAALNDPNNIKTIGLTLTAPKAGATVDLSYDSVTCATPMDYKVVGVDWYKDNATNFLNDRLGRDQNDDHFIGGHSYTVKVTLQTKGDRKWNLDFKQNGDVDYSYITATVNGVTATLEPHQVSPESPDMLCVCYTFENIAVGEFTPYVSIGTPVAGKTKDDVTVAPYSERQMRLIPWGESCNWYVYNNGAWHAMSDNDTFIAGKDYRLVAQFTPNPGFRFSASGTHTVGEDGYIYGYVNGKQMSMKLTKIGGEYQYDYPVTFTYDFESCKAQELGSVSFEGIQAPVAGQHPQYAVTMGDSTYSLVTDDAVSGGAEYGFVNGLAWKLGYGEPLTAQSTFEQGAYYTLSFFIRSDDIHRFTDFVTGSANVGYVSVQTMDDPTLAFVTVDFAPCGGGVITEINIGGVTEPVTGATPDYDFTYGQGYGPGDVDPAIVWVDLTANNKVMTAEDKFEYGHTYELLVVLCTDKALYGEQGEFEFASLGARKAKINGKDGAITAAYQQNPENLWAEVYMTFECAKAPITEVRVTVENPMEGETPAQQIKLGDDTYIVEGFMIADHETNTVLKPDNVYVGAKNYSVTVMINAKEGYRIAEGLTTAFINGQEANVIAYSEDKVLFMLVLLAEELPFYGVSFSDGQSFLTKEGLITLPNYEGSLQENEKFAGWKLADDYSNMPMLFTGEYYISENTEFVAIVIGAEEHMHIYDNSYIDNGQGMHEKRCIDIENCTDPAGSVISGQHQYGNSGPCDVICEICGHERTSESEGYPVHTYEFACSEVCPTCGKQRETTHTPGAAATCTEAQSCTVCAKVLESAKGHTAGEEASCAHAQTCTVCGIELVPAPPHTPGVEWMQDENGHWHACATCNGEADRAEHIDEDGNGVCDVCGYEPKNGLGAGAIVGIVIGSVAVVGIGGFAIYWFVIKKKSFADLVAVFKKK